MKQLKAFPLGKHDDIIDAIAYGFNWLNKFGGGSTIKAGRIAPRTDINGRKYVRVKGNPLLRKYI